MAVQAVVGYGMCDFHHGRLFVPCSAAMRFSAAPSGPDAQPWEFRDKARRITSGLAPHHRNREQDCRIASAGIRSAVAFMVVEKKLGDRAIRKPADSAGIAETSHRELEGLGVSAIGEESAHHRSPPKEAASAHIPTLRPRPRAMAAILLPQCRQLSGKEASNGEASSNARKGRRRSICCQA